MLTRCQKGPFVSGAFLYPLQLQTAFNRLFIPGEKQAIFLTMEAQFEIRSRNISPLEDAMDVELVGTSELPPIWLRKALQYRRAKTRNSTDLPRKSSESMFFLAKHNLRGGMAASVAV
jgi:hypothetical protein